MKNSWRKLGCIYSPNGLKKEWMHSHAAVPIAEHVEDNIFKVYFSSRDEFNRSYTCYLLIDLTRPHEILSLSERPVIGPGALGEFDDSGAMATWLVRHNDRRFLYYIGWNLGVTVPFRNSIGLYVDDGFGNFKRYASGPIVDRSIAEPHFAASCCVLPDQDKWRMWYVSCTGWEMQKGMPRHRYHIKYAESNDGVFWIRNGVIAINYSDEFEYAISRPSVIRENDRWRMWFSHRGSAYRIGYAESLDGIHWRRLDRDCEIDVSVSGWDSEMIEYPYVFDHKGGRYMLYNGNDFGRSGFGLAIMD